MNDASMLQRGVGRVWLGFAAAWLLGACSERTPPPMASDGPHRVVALTVGAVDCLALLGELDRVVAVEEDCFVPGTENKVKIRNDDHAGPSRALNVEAVLALAPDLVIAKESLQSALGNRGLRVQWVSNRSGLDTVVPFLRELGQQLGVPEEAEKAIAQMETKMARIREQVRELPRVKVYYETGGPGRSAGQGTVIDDMIRLAGGTNIAGNLPLANPILSSEAIVAANPEVIVLSPWSDPPEVVSQRAGWDHIRAVQAGRVYQVPEHDRKVQYPSPSCVEGCEHLLVPWLHPEIARAKGPEGK